MKTVITNNGLNLMNQTSASGSTQFWIGYFGLAYVPDEKRDYEDDSETMDLISPDMTTLTVSGDVIYNVFQGAMTPVGLDTDVGETAAYKLFNECMYSGSVTSHYRYVLDENGNNRLVVFADSSAYSSNDENPAGLVEYDSYSGATENAASELPVPAPLYYMGEPSDYQNPPNSPDDKISSDTRVYSSNATDAELPDITSDSWDNNDKYSWASSLGNTYAETLSNKDSYHVLTKYWQYQSVSNFNRFHGAANVSGYAVGYEPACRNISKATKLFPISHYDVISTKDDVTVANVKYTIEVDLASVFSKVSAQSTQYYDSTLAKTSADDYRMGFKFNRIGIYAVPVSLHAFNTDTAGNESCENHSIQMQISGNSEPVLFAAMDLPSPVVLTEDGIHKYTFSFQVNLENSSSIIKDSSVYYNLYESDAITWYKNQLIANASTAEAVTTLGVQLNYMRHQLNNMSSGSAVCGISDDGDMYGYGNSGLKNIVDASYSSTGAVRGIYTYPEGVSIPALGAEGEAPYKSGKYSMTLGKDSAGAGDFSLNMSDYGLIGASSNHLLLMGGSGKTENPLENYLTVKNTSYSIINEKSGEIDHMRSSVWVGSDTDVYTEANVLNSLGIGTIDVLSGDVSTQQLESAIIGYVPSGSMYHSLFAGRNTSYIATDSSVVVGTGAGGSAQNIGKYDAMSDMNAYYMDYRHMPSSDLLDRTIFGGVAGQVNRLLSLGYNSTISRGVSDAIVIGNHNFVGTSTINSIMIGSDIGSAEPYYRPSLVLSVDEFNSRFASEAPENPIAMGDLVVIGSGTLNAGGQTKEVRGVTMYIKYEDDAWDLTNSQTVGSGDGTFGNSPYSYADLYSTGGHLKNMLMVGDHVNVGYGSQNSIMLGDYTGTRQITVKNSFMNFLGDTFAFDHGNGCGPSMTFDNVWWIGHVAKDAGADGDDFGIDLDGNLTSGHIIANQQRQITDWRTCEYKDQFVFIGSDKTTFNRSYWHGMASRDIHDILVNNENTLGWEYSPTNVYQPCKAPMMYSGGIALGGYGTEDCNFMLMKVGYSRNDSNANIFIPDSTPFNYRYGKIVRSTDLNNWSQSVDNTTYLYIEAYDDQMVLSAGNTEIEYTVPSLSRTIKPNTTPTFDLKNAETDAVLATGITGTVGINSFGWTTISATLANAFDVNAKVIVHYEYTDTSAETLYDYVHGSTHHLMVDSPYKGMALVVQDKQELDGTLHVGLGVMGQNVYGNKKCVTLKCSYVNGNLTIDLYDSVTGRMQLPIQYSLNGGVVNGDPVQLGPVSAGGFTLEGKVQYTRDTSVPDSPTIAHVYGIHLLYDMDEGYIMTLYADSSIDDNYQYVDYTANGTIEYINDKSWICGTNGSNLYPSYLYMHNNTTSARHNNIDDIFQGYLQASIGLYNHSPASITNNHQVFALQRDNVYKIMPVKWYLTDSITGQSNPFIPTYQSATINLIHYPTRYEVYDSAAAAREGLVIQPLT